MLSAWHAPAPDAHLTPTRDSGLLGFLCLMSQAPPCLQDCIVLPVSVMRLVTLGVTMPL